MANYNSNNLIGQSFGLLKVIEKTNKRTSNRSVIWKCQCDCGNIVEVATPELKRQDGKGTRSCGCLKTSTIDLTNKRYGELVVLQLSDKDDGHRHKLWKCQCNCGAIVYVTTHDLVRTDGKGRRSCNNKCSTISNEIGKVYGKLTVLQKDETKHQGEGAYWICKCDCGNIVNVRGHYLRAGATTSCGCIRSKGEMKIGNILSQYNISYEKEYTFIDLISNKGSKLRFDFCVFDKNHQIIGLIEFQGIQHYEPGFGKTEKEFEQSLLRDQQKIEYCKNHSIPLLIIPYWDYDKIDIYYILENLIKLKDSEN